MSCASEEYDLIYLQPEDFALIVFQQPHHPLNSQLSSFLSLKEVEYKPVQQKFRFVQEVHEKTEFVQETKMVQCRQGTCMAFLCHEKKQYCQPNARIF